MPVLEGLRVVEISGMGAAAQAARFAADWGATVTILEPPGGTPLRDEPPYYEKDGKRKSANWEWISRGKTAVTVNQQQARALCEAADVVFAEADFAREVLGLGAHEVRAWLTGKTTVVFMPGFPMDGPIADYRATDLGFMARSGWASNLREYGREPLRPGGGLLHRIAGVWGFLLALIARRHLRQGGAPQFVELPLQPTASSFILGMWISRALFGTDRLGPPNPNAWPANGVLECMDGFFGCQPLTATHWEMMCHMLGISDILDIPGGREPEYRANNGRDLYEARVKPYLMTQSKHDLMRQAQEWRIPAAPIESVDERLVDEQLNARGFFKEWEVEGRTVKVPRVPYLVNGMEPVQRAPLVEAGTPPTPAPAAAAAGGAPFGKPFAGIRILDLTHFWAGPYATSLMGALGADVIKVESIQRPDAYRYTSVSSAVPMWYEQGVLWLDTNCNKRDLTINLASEEGKQIFSKLLETADVVISNFSNRVLPNLGLTDEYMHSINPRLLLVTLPGYGPDGPWGNWVGYGVAFEQLASCASMTGYPDGQPRIPGGFADPTSGLLSVTAMELALMRREQTGEGAIIQIPQCEVVDSLWGPEMIAVQLGAPVPTRVANRHPWMAPHNAYQVLGNDEWITIAVATDGEFRALAQELGKPSLADDPRFATVAARKENEEALDEAIRALVRDEPLVTLETRLQAAGVMAVKVSRNYRLDQDDSLQQFGYFQELSRPVTGTFPNKTFPFHVDGKVIRNVRPSPTLGQHNEEVLRDLGLSDAEIEDLREKQVIGTVPVGFGG